MTRARIGLAVALAGLSMAGCATMPREQATSEPDTASLAGSYLAANFAVSVGDMPSAARFFSHTLENDPENGDLLQRSFLFRAAAGDIDSAVAMADEVLARQPDNRPARLVGLIGLLGTKEYSALVSRLQTSPGGAFTALTDSLMEAWALAGLGRTDDALAAVDRIGTQEGAGPLHAFQRAILLDYAGRVSDADAAYRSALRGGGVGARGVEAYARFLTRQNREEEARALYAGAGSDNRAQSVVLLALASEAKSQPLVSSPAQGVAEGLFAIAASLNGRRNGDVAMLYLHLALYLHPDFDLARVFLADRYERMQQFDAANVQYESVPVSSPYRMMVEVQRAINVSRLGRPGDALAAMRKLSDENPESVDILTALGDLQRREGQYQEAASTYGRALLTMPEDDVRRAGLLFARGVSFTEFSHWENAEADFRASLSLDPERPEVLNYLGFSWVERGKNLDQAVEMLEKAHALRPMDGYIADSVGWAYYKLGRYQEAVDMLEQAVVLAPAAADVNDHLGDAYWRLGRKLDARFQWRHALSLKPAEAAKPVIERKLQLGLDAISASGS